VAPEQVAGTGTVDTFTVNYQEWRPGLETPYVIARVAIDGAVRGRRKAGARLRGLSLQRDVLCALQDLHLGEVEHPQSTGKPRLDLPLAKHTIDLLSMLQAKTKGNLTSQEDKLLESLLFDLRLRYVAAAKPAG